MTQKSPWWQQGIIYQIYPRSYADSNQDGIGDLPGILSHLDYLSWLGIDAIWLSPIYPSPNVDFGYDITNHCAIDPIFGTLQDFDDLVSEAHRLNIRIIMDLVLAHTSDQHPWFQQARLDRTNPFHDYYIWADPKPGKRVPNNWQSIMGGKYWQYEPVCQQFYGHMFYPQQPDLNWHNPAVQDEMTNIFLYWLERGVDGFRLDVFSSYFKNPHFYNQPFTLGRRPFEMQQHIHDHNQPELENALRSIRQLVDQYPDRYLVGEPFLPNIKSSARYVKPDMLHAAFHLKFTGIPWNASRMLASIQSWESELDPEAWPCHVLNNHDVSRTSSRFRCGQEDDRLKVAATLLLTLRGTPFIYYGEEIGQRDIKLTRSQIKDPIGLKYWPFFRGRDFGRAPMQWNLQSFRGFSTSTPWLPVNPDYITRNVQTQQSDPTSLLNWYRQLIKLRRDLPSLQSGIFQPVTFEPRHLLAYLRQTNDQSVLVILNFGHRPTQLYLGSALLRTGWSLLASSKQNRTEIKIRSGKLSVYSQEALLLLNQA